MYPTSHQCARDSYMQRQPASRCVKHAARNISGSQRETLSTTHTTTEGSFWCTGKKKSTQKVKLVCGRQKRSQQVQVEAKEWEVLWHACTAYCKLLTRKTRNYRCSKLYSWMLFSSRKQIPARLFCQDCIASSRRTERSLQQHVCWEGLVLSRQRMQPQETQTWQHSSWLMSCHTPDCCVLLFNWSLSADEF